MDISPHTMNTILEMVREQVRCPQCASRVPVEFSSVKVMTDEFVILEMRCTGCGTFMVLQVSAKAGGAFSYTDESKAIHNASSSIAMSETEIAELNKVLKEGNGSFAKIFKTDQKKD